MAPTKKNPAATPAFGLIKLGAAHTKKKTEEKVSMKEKLAKLRQEMAEEKARKAIKTSSRPKPTCFKEVEGVALRKSTRPMPVFSGKRKQSPVQGPSSEEPKIQWSGDIWEANVPDQKQPLKILFKKIMRRED